MSLSEQSRFELHRGLEEVIGSERAATLMAHLPPTGWADVATKQDLAALEGRMDLRFARIDLRFDGIDQRFDVIDQRFDVIDQRFEAIDQCFEAIDHRFDAIDGRFQTTDQRLEERLQHFETSILLELHRTLVSHLRIVMFGMISSVVAVGGLVIAAVKL